MLRGEMKRKEIMAATGLSSCCSCLSSQSLYRTNRFVISPRLFMASNAVKLRTSLRVRASSSGGEEEEGRGNGLSKEDWNYLLQLGAGSFAGAAAIKYGSILFPEITRPNIFLALLMIWTPVIVAIVLLGKQSRA